MNRLRSASAALSVILLSICGTAAAYDSPQSEESPDFLEIENNEYSNPINEVDALGERVWYGEENSAVAAVENVYSELTAREVSNIVGAALTSDRQAIEIYVLDFDGEGVEELKSAAFDSPESLILIKNEFSNEDYQDIDNAITAEDMVDQGINFVAPDPINDTYKVGIAPEIFESEEDSGLALVTDIVDDTGTEVEVEASIVPAEEEHATASRERDTSYFSAGAKIIRPGMECSLGIPIVVKGKFYALTAGHCGSGTWTNGIKSTTVGKSYTTTWPGNAINRGDFQVLSGSQFSVHYGLKLFTGGPTSAATGSISRGDFGLRPRGAELCASGARTGTTCRYSVIEPNASRNVDGVKVGQLTTTIHDSNRDKIGDCNGFDYGDSGGPAYYSDLQYGGNIMYGIMTSTNKSGSCSYSFTRLSGVRKWQASVDVG